jgi:hypothetical protein
MKNTFRFYSTSEAKGITSLYDHYNNALNIFKDNKETCQSLRTVIFANNLLDEDVYLNYLYKKYATLPYNYIMFDRLSGFSKDRIAFCANYHTFIKFTLLGKHLETSKKLFTYEDFENPTNFEDNMITWCGLHNIEVNLCMGFS